MPSGSLRVVTGEALSTRQIEEALVALPGWEFDGTHIRKEYSFAGFKSAIAFIVRIAFEAEKADHHPDLENHYNKVVVAFRSWDADGITERDVLVAGAVEKVAASS